MNYKCYPPTPKYKQVIKFNCALNLQLLAKTKKIQQIQINYHSPHRSERSKEPPSPNPLQLRFHNNYRISRPATQFKGRSNSIKDNKLSVETISLHKKKPLYENLNYGSPQIFQKMSPEFIISTSKIIIPSKYQIEAPRVKRAETQYSIHNNSPKISIAKKIKTTKASNLNIEPSGLDGWNVDPMEEMF